jgi:hypothetical protein
MNRRESFERSAGSAPPALLLPSMKAAGQGGSDNEPGVWPENGTLIPDASAFRLESSDSFVEIVSAYSRDHDRQIGAGAFVMKLGCGNIVYQRVPSMDPVLQVIFLANAPGWLAEVTSVRTTWRRTYELG